MKFWRKTPPYEPDLFGPILSCENLPLQQAMNYKNATRKLKLITSFVPDELVCLLKSEEKLIEYDFVILLCIDISNVHSFLDEVVNVNNISLSYNSTEIYNLHISTIIETIYFDGGDVIKYSDHTILSLWKQDMTKMPHELMGRVIKAAFVIRKSVNILKNIFFSLSKAALKTAISAGSITFSAIGHTDTGQYVIAGEPMTAVRQAIEIGKSGDLILAESAWEHCILSNYVYVIQDKSHIKMIREIKRHDSSVSFIRNDEYLHKFVKMSLASVKSIFPADTLNRCRANLEVSKTKLNLTMQHFIMKSVLEQINTGKSLKYLTEMRNVCIVSIEIELTRHSVSELILFANKSHAIVVKACESVGCIEDVSVRESSVFYCIVFGAQSYLKNLNHCQFGVTCALKLLRTLERMNHVDRVSVGVSAGTSCCTVVGNVARRLYAIISPTINKSERMMLISRNKVICDLNAVIYSDIEKSLFVSVQLEEMNKESVFQYNDEIVTEDDIDDFNVGYPILDRFQELEHFSDILNDIGLAERHYRGIVIEGASRVGKSRVLDAFVAAATARQIGVLKLALHSSYATKPYSVIYKILEQMLGAEDLGTLDEMQRNIIKKLGHVIQVDDLCYMNKIFRVQFKLSSRYILDSDWDRYKKSIHIFDRVLRELNQNQPQCILLDNVHHMDYMSWQMLSRALNNENIVLAMTMLECESWEELSRVETDICKDKRLLHHTLNTTTAQNSSSLSILVCQLLEVQAISLELHEFITNSSINHPGWYELFLTLMTLCNGLELVDVTPNKASMQQLFFPDMLYVTRIANDLLPEEVAPPLPWNKRNKIAVCLTNEKFRDLSNKFEDNLLTELASEIYDRLSTCEQDIVKCASLFGEVIHRQDLEMLIWNHESMVNLSAIEHLIRIRIFECAAMQRNCNNNSSSTKVAELSTASAAAAACSIMPRSTFSDMHHLLRCRCHSASSDASRDTHFPQYAYCQYMEFKVSVFQEAVYERITENEKKVLYEKLMEMLEKDAKKCIACGGGSFLTIPGKESKSFKPTPSVLSVDEHEMMEDESVYSSRRATLNQRLSQSQDSDINNISIMQASEANEVDDMQHDRLMSVEQHKKTFAMSAKTRIHPTLRNSASRRVILKNFHHIDFRYCRCIAIIDSIFWKLKRHVKYIGNNEKVIDFMMEYAAALIDYGQPSYALRFLAKANERNEYVNTYNPWKNPVVLDKIIKKSVIHCLRGNAYILLGNYPQAKTNYTSALSLYKHNFYSSELTAGYRTMYERVVQSIRWTFSETMCSVPDDEREEANIIEQNVASCLSLVSMIYMIGHRYKTAKLASMQSIVFGFSSFDSVSFHNQCQLYLTTAQISVQLEDLSLATTVEKYMLYVIGKKLEWNDSDDLVAVAEVYLCISRISILRGQLEKGVTFAIKSLNIARSFHIVRLELKLSPLLVQTCLQLKQIDCAMNALHQFRDIGTFDIDKSSITWYYALCMDLLLDAGIYLECHETCVDYARMLFAAKPDYCIVRDPSSMKRLAVDLWLWHLRKGEWTATEFAMSLDYFITDFAADDSMQIITLCKVAECHLILLMHCISIKKGNQMEMLLVDVDKLMKLLKDVTRLYNCAKPYYYLFKAYLYLLHSRVNKSNTYLRKAMKIARTQKNFMALACICQNKKTWKAASYNNMARHWEENIGYRNAIYHWQDVDAFVLREWSNLLYSLPAPDTYI